MVTVLNLDTSATLLKARPNRRLTGPRNERSRKRAPGAVQAGRLAERLARDGERSLQRYLPLHDTGTWSLYGLLTPGYKWRKHVADVGYHCYHVRLLRMLQDQAPGYGFRAWAAKWDGYAKARGVSCERGKATPQPGTVIG
jgi:hypothetical protein